MDTAFRAPWGSQVLVSTAVVAAIAATVGLLMWRNASPLPLRAVLAVVFLLPLPTMVVGYSVTPDTIRVRRIAWPPVTLPIRDLIAVDVVPDAMKGSRRLFGNGGQFSITGRFSSPSLGRFQAYVTDPRRTVVLRYPTDTYVVSPDQPETFVRMVRAQREIAK